MIINHGAHRVGESLNFPCKAFACEARHTNRFGERARIDDAPQTYVCRRLAYLYDLVALHPQ